MLKIGIHKAFLCSISAHVLFFKRVSVWRLARGTACLSTVLSWSDCNTKLKVEVRTDAAILYLSSSFRFLAASTNRALCFRCWYGAAQLTFFLNYFLFWQLWLILLCLTFPFLKSDWNCHHILRTMWRVLCKPLCYLGYVSTNKWVEMEEVCSPGCCRHLLQGRVL